MRFESEAFDVPQTIAEYARKKEYTKVIENASFKQPKPEVLKKNASVNKFNEDMLLIHKQLLKFLAVRNRKRLESNLTLPKMAQVEKFVLKNAKRHISNSSRRTAPTRSLWLNSGDAIKEPIPTFNKTTNARNPLIKI